MLRGVHAALTSTPTPVIAKGELYADSLVVAFGIVLSDGRLRAGFGINSIQAFPPSGTYDITLHLSGADAFTLVPVVCGYNGDNCIVTAGGTAKNKVRVFASNVGAANGVTAPHDFCILVFAV